MTPLRSAVLLSTALALPPGGAAERNPLPEKLLIAKWGTASALDGTPVTVGPLTLSALLENQRKIGRAEIALDFEHGTVESGPEPRPVAGYGTLSVESGVGIWYHPTTWTPEGASYYTGRHYRDISPTVIRDDRGEIIALHSVALTRAGQLDGLHAFSTPSLRAAVTTLSATSPTPPSPDNKSPIMKELLCKILDLPDTATDEEITAAATQFISAMSSEEKPEPSPMSTEAKPDAEPTPMSAIAAFRAELDDHRRDRMLDQAKAAGKVIPLSAAALRALPLTTLSALLEGLQPGQVPLAPATPGTDTGGGQPKALSAGESSLCKLLGVTEEKFRTLAPTV